MSDYKNDGKFVLKTKQESKKEFKQWNKKRSENSKSEKVKKHNQKKSYKKYQKDKRAGFGGGVKSGLSTVAVLFFLILFNAVMNIGFSFFNRSYFEFNFTKYSYNKEYYYNQFYAYDNKIKFVNFDNFTFNNDYDFTFNQLFHSGENYIITISSKGSFEGKLTLIIKGYDAPFSEDIVFTFETEKDFNNFVWNWEHDNSLAYKDWVFSFEDFTTKNLQLTFRSIRLTQNYELKNGGLVVGVFEETINVITNTIDFTMGLVNSIYVVLDEVVGFILNLIGGG